MKILITQAEQKNPPFFFVHDALERAWYHLLAGHELIPAPNIPNYDWDKIEYDCLVLTGGNDSIARHLTENHLYQKTKAAGKPIIGFCHGAFAVNDLAAGINGRAEGHVGSEHLMLMDNRRFTVNSYHSQIIMKLPPGFESLGMDSDGNPEAFRHLFEPIYGVVWHPERMEVPVLPACVADFLRTPLSKF